MDYLFKESSKKIRIYLSVDTINDPFEKTVTTSLLPPLPINAIVTDYTASQAMWKIEGIRVSKAKEIIVEKKHRSLIEKSQKIEVDGESYEGWRVNGKMQIREEDNYLRIYIYSKHV